MNNDVECIRTTEVEVTVLKRLKPYKAVDPLETVQVIRSLLSSNDLFVIEAAHKTESVTGVCSCRIILGDEGLRELNIGSNGKGTTARYSLASAYAEFMERLQNGATLWKTSGVPRTAPGAVKAQRDELRAATVKLLTFAFPGEKDAEKVADRYLQTTAESDVFEFANLVTGEKAFFPVFLYNKLCGSNGMAAGNTPTEAILQGLSEVFERAALHELFSKPICAPVIDDAVFEGTDALSDVRKLRNAGFACRILDCSLGVGLPVVAVLLEKGGSYHIHFGADPSAITALERCITEIFQGRSTDSLPLFPPLPRDADAWTLFKNEEREYSDSTGCVPEWLIDGTPSWEFSGFTHAVTHSDEDDLDYYLSILSNLGKQLYVRDSSALGFPTVRVYVPGFTENHCLDIWDCIDPVIPDGIRSSLLRLPSLNNFEHCELAKQLKQWLEADYAVCSTEDYFRKRLPALNTIFPAGLFAARRWDTQLLIAAIYLRGGLEAEGNKLLERYLSEKKISGNEATVLRRRTRSKTLAFLPTEFPQCPNCEKCRAIPRCRKSEIEELEEKLSALLSTNEAAPISN